MARYLQRVNLQGNECTYNDAASSSPGLLPLRACTSWKALLRTGGRGTCRGVPCPSRSSLRGVSASSRSSVRTVCRHTFVRSRSCTASIAGRAQAVPYLAPPKVRIVYTSQAQPGRDTIIALSMTACDPYISKLSQQLLHSESPYLQTVLLPGKEQRADSKYGATGDPPRDGHIERCLPACVQQGHSTVSRDIGSETCTLTLMQRGATAPSATTCLRHIQANARLLQRQIAAQNKQTSGGRALTRPKRTP